MTQEDKDLLIQDLVARLPYGVKCTTKSSWDGIYTIEGYKDDKFFLDCPVYDEGDDEWMIESVVPYLRPISSMTEEEVDHLFHILKINEENGKEWIKVNDIGIIRLFTEEGKDFYEIAEAMDYLHSIHIDYRGLISKGLAIAVTKDNNPYKE